MANLVKLKSLCTRITDGSHYSPIGIKEGYPMLSVKDMTDFGFSYNDCKYISKEDYDKLVLADCKPKLNDLLIAKDGSYLKHVFVIKQEIEQVILSSIGILRPNLKKIYPNYLKYYLQTKSVKETVAKKYVSGSALPRIILKGFEQIEVIYKDLHTQKSIAKVLSDLDTKIELKNKINRELEAMAKTLYDYWFVQFDFPVDNNFSPSGEMSEGQRGYKSSGGKMVYNAELKREIPEGWGVKNIFKCCNVQYGFPFSTDYFNTDCKGVPVIRIRDILENSISNYSFEQNIDAKYLIKKGDILVGMDGNFHINYWAKDGCYLNQRAVKLSETILPNIYLKYQIEPFIKLREKSVSRTTVGHLSDKDLKALSIIIPSKEVLSSISSIYNGLLKRMIQTQNENQQLSELRDWLLPMLMNGQVTIRKAHGTAEAEEMPGMVAEREERYGEGF